MVNNSINISNTGNHLSPQAKEHKITTPYDVGNPVSGLIQA
jgi:hypothetical protein